MMTDREKLFELITEALQRKEGTARVVGDYYTNRIVDYLIANGVTVPNHGHWIIRSSGRGKYATNWAECSNCRVCGSPQWKVCPVCETRMEDSDG